MIDGELVNRKLLLIAKDVEALERLAALTLDAFLGTSTNAVLAERYVERAVGAGGRARDLAGERRVPRGNDDVRSVAGGAGGPHVRLECRVIVTSSGDGIDLALARQIVRRLPVERMGICGACQA